MSADLFVDAFTMFTVDLGTPLVVCKKNFSWARLQFGQGYSFLGQFASKSFLTLLVNIFLLYKGPFINYDLGGGGR